MAAKTSGKLVKLGVPAVIVVLLAVLAWAFLGEAFMSSGKASEAAGQYDAAAGSYLKAERAFKLFGKADKREKSVLAILGAYSALNDGVRAADTALRLHELQQKRGASAEEQADTLATAAYYTYSFGSMELAAHRLELAFELDHECPMANYVAGLISHYEDNDFAASVRHITLAVDEARTRQDKRLGVFLLARAEVQVAVDNFRRAQRDLEAAITEGYTDRRVWTLLVKCRVRMAEFEEAAKVCEQALEVFPGSVVLLSSYATIQVLRGEPAKAVALFDKVVGADQTVFREAIFTRGITRWMLEEHQAALDDILTARDADPVLSSVIIFALQREMGIPQSEALNNLSTRAAEYADPRLDFYLSVLAGRYSSGDQSRLLSLRNNQPISPEDGRKALDELGYPPRVPLSAVPWQETAFVFGLAVYLHHDTPRSFDPAQARAYLSEALKTNEYFHWTYLASKHLVNRIDKIAPPK